MALTITYDFPRPVRTERGNRSAVAMISGTIAFDNSYPTGGEALTGLSAKFKTLLRVVCEQNTGYLFEFDKTNTKLKVYAPVNVVAGDGTAATNNFLFKNTGPVLEVDGTGTAFQLPGAEVLDTTDLSGLTAVSFYAVGLM